MGLVFVSIQPVCLLVGTFSPLTFKVISDMYVLIAILLIALNLFLLLFFFPSFLVLSSSGLMTIFSVVFELIFLCVSIVDFWFSVILKFCCKCLYVYEIVLSYCSLNCTLISSVLHLYPPLLMISDFVGIIVHG